jgi:hypothetical protein
MAAATPRIERATLDGGVGSTAAKAELAAGLRAVGLWLCRRAGTQVVLDNGGELLAVSCQQRTVLPPCGSILQETEVGGREGKRRLGALSRVEVALGRDEGHGRMGRTGLVSLRLLRPSGPLHGEVRERRREELHQEASGSRGSDRMREAIRWGRLRFNIQISEGVFCKMTAMYNLPVVFQFNTPSDP